jgi:hypothetical protein
MGPVKGFKAFQCYGVTAVAGKMEGDRRREASDEAIFASLPLYIIFIFDSLSLSIPRVVH